MHLVLGRFDRLGVQDPVFDLAAVFSRLGMPTIASPVILSSPRCVLGQGARISENRDRVAVCGGLSFVGNIRLDNRSELVSRLGESYADCPVSKLVLLAYRKWGEQCVEYLLGDFAFGIWDSDEGKLFLARDRVGVYPFYYYANRDTVVFGSDLGAVGAFEEVPAELDNEWIGNTLACVGLPDMKERTYLKAVRLLPNASSIAITSGKIDRRVYWSLESVGELRFKRDSDYLERFRELFYEAVKSRMPNDGNVGLELSAGLDSSAIASVLASSGLAGERVRAFSHIGRKYMTPSGGGASDEKQLTHKLSVGLKLGSLQWIDGPLTGALELFSCQCAESGGVGLESWSTFSKPLYQEAKGQGCGVLFSGAGGDELVTAQAAGAYYEFLKRGELNRWFREINLEGQRKGWSSKVRAKRVLLSVLHSGCPRLASLLARKKAWESEHFLNEDVALEYSISERKRAYFDFLAFGSLKERQIRNLCNSYLSSQRLPKSFAVSFNEGIEIRYPMLDTRLLEYCYAVPPHLARSGGFGRFLVREGLWEIPDFIRYRDDKAVPAIPWVRPYLAEQADVLRNAVRLDHRLASLLDLEAIQDELTLLCQSGRTASPIGQRALVLSLIALCS